MENTNANHIKELINTGDEDNFHLALILIVGMGGDKRSDELDDFDYSWLFLKTWLEDLIAKGQECMEAKVKHEELARTVASFITMGPIQIRVRDEAYSSAKFVKDYLQAATERLTGAILLVEDLQNGNKRTKIVLSALVRALSKLPRFGMSEKQTTALNQFMQQREGLLGKRRIKQHHKAKAMPRTPLPTYRIDGPLLRGHITAASRSAYDDNKPVYKEFWLKVLHLRGVHPLGVIPDELWQSLSDKSKHYVRRYWSEHEKELIINKEQKKKDAARKRARKCR